MASAPHPARSDPYTLVARVAAALPDGYTVECIGGRIVALPRPRNAHVRVASRLGGELSGFDRPRRPEDPGGWVILDEPEVHLGADHDVVVPDLAGWRRARLADGDTIAECEHGYYALAPDWVCEVLSPSTEGYDRGEKLPLYARAAIGFVWLLDPAARTLEVFGLHGAEYRARGTFSEAATARAEPFGALGLELSALWAR